MDGNQTTSTALGDNVRTRDKVAIGWIDGGTVDGDFAAHLFQLASVRHERIDILVRIEGHLLSRQRNELVSAFLRLSSAEWLLMLDTDHRFTPIDFDNLCASVHDVSAPVVSGLYFGSFPSGGLYPTAVPIAFSLDPNGVDYHALSAWTPGKMIPVDAVGGGCLLIHRSVLEKIRDNAADDVKDWCWFMDGPANGRWYSEDMVFCQRVRDAGFPIYVNPDVTLPHLKTYWLTVEHFAAQKKAAIEVETAAFSAPVRAIPDVETRSV